MSALDPAEARRLTSSLALLASNHHGEVLAAAGAAKRILEKNGLGFSDLGVTRALPSPRPTPQPNPARTQPGEAARPHQQQARRCLGSSLVAWKAHERQFLEQMAAQLRRPTEPQRDWLDGLVDRLARKAREASSADF